MTTGLRGANVRVEKRLDGSLAVRHGETVSAGHRMRCGREAEAALRRGRQPGHVAPAGAAATGIRISI